MTFNLTPRQADLLRFIREFIDRNGYAPSIEEMVTGIGNKPPNGKSNVHRMLRCLKDRGRIDYLPRKFRSVTVIKPASRSAA